MFIPRNIKLIPAELWLNNKWEYLAYFILLPVGGVIYSDWCWPVCFLNNQIPHPRVSEQVILAGRATHDSASKYSIEISSEGCQLKTGFAFCEKTATVVIIAYTVRNRAKTMLFSFVSTVHSPLVFCIFSPVRDSSRLTRTELNGVTVHTILNYFPKQTSTKTYNECIKVLSFYL